MKKTKEEAAQTRAQLLDSALELFIKYGYSKVSLQQIAEYVGLSRGAFYWHFKSKEEILEAIVVNEKHFIENMMADLFSKKNLSPEKHLKLVITEIVNNYYNNTRYRNFVELTWFKIESYEYVKTNQEKTVANEFFIDETEKIIKTGIKNGVFVKDVSAIVWATQICALINGIYRLYFITPAYMSKQTALKLTNNTIRALMKK